MNSKNITSTKFESSLFCLKEECLQLDEELKLRASGATPPLKLIEIWLDDVMAFYERIHKKTELSATELKVLKRFIVALPEVKANLNH